MARNKFNKRLAKKLAKTGRTKTYQPIGKKAVNKQIEHIKTLPKPDLEAKKRADEIKVREELKLKEYLINMLISSDDLTPEQKRQLEDKIYRADTDLLMEINDIFNDDEGTWKDFYNYNRDTEAGFMDEMDYIAAVQTVLDVLDIKY